MLLHVDHTAMISNYSSRLFMERSDGIETAGPVLQDQQPVVNVCAD